MGQKSSKEISIIAKLKEMGMVDAKIYFLIWKYAPQLLQTPNIKSFDELRSNYKVLQSKGYTEEFCNNWLVETNVQSAVKWLLARLHQQKMIDLYEIYYNASKTDVQSFKAFVDFSKDFFKDNKENELVSFLNSVDVNETEDLKESNIE